MSESGPTWRDRLENIDNDGEPAGERAEEGDIVEFVKAGKRWEGRVNEIVGEKLYVENYTFSGRVDKSNVVSIAHKAE